MKRKAGSRVFGFILSGDRLLMRRVNRWPAPRWVRLWMTWSTRGGNGGLWCAMGAVILMFGGEQRFRALSASALATGTGVLLFRAMKKPAGRKRPCATEPHCWANLLPPDQFSFPSGHSQTAFAVAVTLGLFYPALLPGLLFCAGSVAASRVLLGMHFLSDVLAGSGIGAGLGYAAFRLVR